MSRRHTPVVFDHITYTSPKLKSITYTLRWSSNRSLFRWLLNFLARR